MEKTVPCVMNMTDMEYYHYMTSCNELNAKLEKCVTFLMHYIFEGKCKDKDQWEALFISLSRAVFMKEYLQLYLTNIGAITEDFLVQFEDWHAELAQTLN